MKSDDLKRNLLNSLLETGHFAGRNDQVRRRAYSSLKRRIYWRRSMAGAFLCLPLILLLFLLPFSDDIPNQEVLPPAQAHQPEPNDPEKKPFLTLISEEELLNHFPSSSCFIAEVNGQKVLVFHDQELKMRIFAEH